MKILVVLIMFTSLIACSQNEKPKHESAAAETPAPANQQPDFLIVFLDGQKKSFQTLEGKVALILFQPDCDHCQREAADIEKNLPGFKDFKLYFVSSASLNEIDAFAREYKLKDKPNVFFGTTEAVNVLKHFGPVETPSLYLYSEQKQLIESFNGEVAIEVVVKYI